MGTLETGIPYLGSLDAPVVLSEFFQYTCSHCNNFRYHVWWHKALLHMDKGEFDVALGLYDARIRADKTDDYRDISNATSLLMRLELEGVDVGPRWHELADLAEARTDDGCLVFADLHYMLALTGARESRTRWSVSVGSYRSCSLSLRRRRVRATRLNALGIVASSDSEASATSW